MKHVRIIALEARKYKLEAEISRVEAAIHQLQKECPHDDVDKSASWEVEQVVEGMEDYREVLERRITCRYCGQAWNEQTYADSDEPWPYDQRERA